jgi:hypothetical protein
MEDSWLLHPWHGASAFMPLFAAKRHNNTVVHVPRQAAGFAPWRRDRTTRGAAAEDARHRDLHSAPFGAEDGEEAEDGQEEEEEGAGDGAAAVAAGSAQRVAPAHGYRLTRGGPGVPLPPMDYVLFTAREHEDVGEWMAGAWPLLSQPHTSLLLHARVARELNLSSGAVLRRRRASRTADASAQTSSFAAAAAATSDGGGGAAAATSDGGGGGGDSSMGRSGRSWVCAQRGVVTGLQPRLFAGVADAAAFRLHAWALAGLPVAQNAVRPHDAYPPRRILVLGRRETRRFRPEAAVRRLVAATGLPVDWVDDLTLSTWSEQVRLFAGAGIIVAAHGASLTNLMFAPAHAAVIELTPYLLNWPLYARLAASANLAYHRVPSLKLGKLQLEAGALLADADFDALCERQVSSLDANSLIACNGRSKNSDIHVDAEALAHALAMALDDIGCRPRQFPRGQAELLHAAQLGRSAQGLQLALELGVGNGTHLDERAVRFVAGDRKLNLRAHCTHKDDSLQDANPWEGQR